MNLDRLRRSINEDSDKRERLRSFLLDDYEPDKESTSSDLSRKPTLSEIDNEYDNYPEPMKEANWLRNSLYLPVFSDIVLDQAWSTEASEKAVRLGALWEMNHHRRQVPRISDPWASCPPVESLSIIDLAIMGTEEGRLLWKLTGPSLNVENYDPWADISKLLRLKQTPDIEDYPLIREYEEAGIRIISGHYGSYITDDVKIARVPKTRNPHSLTVFECQELLAAAPERKRSERASRFAEWYSDEQRQVANLGESGQPTPDGPFLTRYSQKEIENVDRLLEFRCETSVDRLLRAECLRMLGRFEDCCRTLADFEAQSKEQSLWAECLNRKAQEQDQFVARLE